MRAFWPTQIGGQALQDAQFWYIIFQSARSILHPVSDILLIETAGGKPVLPGAFLVANGATAAEALGMTS